jgi:hypothetical protein
MHLSRIICSVSSLKWTLFSALFAHDIVTRSLRGHASGHPELAKLLAELVTHHDFARDGTEESLSVRSR